MSKISKISSLSQWMVIALFGVLCCRWLNDQLKGVIGERLNLPFSNSRFAHPSGHAQEIAFLVVFSVLVYHSTHAHFFQAIGWFFVVMMILCVYVCHKEGFHTPRHLVWGAIVGAAFAWWYVSILPKNRESEPTDGIEPTTYSLRKKCSTN